MGLVKDVAALAAVLVAVASPCAAAPPGPSTFTAWQAAHPNLDGQIADLKSKTAVLIAAAGPAPPAKSARYAALVARSKALSPPQRTEADAQAKAAQNLWQAGDFAAARKGFAAVLDIDPANAMANMYMGDFLEREGDMAGAAIAMDKARTFAPGSAEAVKADEALAILAAPPETEANLDRPPMIWRVPGAVAEVWDGPDAPLMAVIPAGEFTMGSAAAEAGRKDNEGPRHRVRIAYPLAVSKTPVTVAQYARFVADTHYDAGSQCQTFNGQKWEWASGCSWAKPNFAQTEDGPAVSLTWGDAQAYAAWLSRKTGHSYRLLSEAEYEYANRAGTTTAFWWGDDPAAACANANGAGQETKAQFQGWDVNSCSDGHVFTAPVGSFKPNPFGLYDTAGNSWSWVQDCWISSYVGAPSDGSANVVDGCTQPMIRGGAWTDSPSSLRSASRGWNLYNVRFTINGFRIARVL